MGQNLTEQSRRTVAALLRAPEGAGREARELMKRLAEAEAAELRVTQETLKRLRSHRAWLSVYESAKSEMLRLAQEVKPLVSADCGPYGPANLDALRVRIERAQQTLRSTSYALRLRRVSAEQHLGAPLAAKLMDFAAQVEAAAGVTVEELRRAGTFECATQARSVYDEVAALVTPFEVSTAYVQTVVDQIPEPR